MRASQTAAVQLQCSLARSAQALSRLHGLCCFFFGRLIRVRGEAGTDQWRKRMALTVDSNALLEGDDELGEMIGQ